MVERIRSQGRRLITKLMTKRLLPAFAILAVIVLLGVAVGILFGGSSVEEENEATISTPQASDHKTASTEEKRAPLINLRPMAASTQFYQPREFKTLSDHILTYFWLEPEKPHRAGLNSR